MERKVQNRPDLLDYLEGMGFAWQDNGMDNREQAKSGFAELDKFFRIASLPQFRAETMMVCTYLDKHFWHPMIGFLEEVHPYGYRGFCLERYGSEIPHSEGKPDRHAFSFTIDMMQKIYGNGHIDADCWSSLAELPDCTKSPVILH